MSPSDGLGECWNLTGPRDSVRGTSSREEQIPLVLGHKGRPIGCFIPITDMMTLLLATFVICKLEQSKIRNLKKREPCPLQWFQTSSSPLPVLHPIPTSPTCNMVLPSEPEYEQVRPTLVSSSFKTLNSLMCKGIGRAYHQLSGFLRGQPTIQESP